MSRENYNLYINNSRKDFSKKILKIKTALLINGEIRNADNFIKWIKKVKDYTRIYIYTDKSSFSKLNKDYRKYLEEISTGLCFSEDDPLYQENLNINKNQSSSYQWLKFRQSFYKWKNDWEIMGIKTILRMRTDIAFLNPHLLEYQIKNGFSGIVSEGIILGRSDLLFAFNIKDSKTLADFYDSIFSFYLSEDWINYPYIPLNPDLIIKAKGSMRIEWNNFPSKYIGLNPTKEQFFERIAASYDEILSEYENYLLLGKYDYKKRDLIFGNLSTVRIQSIRIITSERNFAHYLVQNGIKLIPHNNLLSGQIIRERNRKIKFLKNLVKNKLIKNY